VSTLVVCVDRGGDLADGEPVVGRDVIERLVMEVGMTDPETSRVNSFLETLRVADDIEADGEEAIVAVVSGGGDGVDADRAVARQTDELVDEYAPDSAVVVTDSAEDERLVPIVESRVQVDAVDRVVVRQSHDIESTYYVLKQFLADEELRATVLVPIGAALLAFPVLLLLADSLAVAVSAIAAVIGVFLLYKGLGVDDWLAALPGAVRDAFYSGQVSLVTYVVGAGLATVGLFAGAIDISNTAASPVIMGMRFVFAAVPWLALAALTASTGRLIDEFLDEERVPNAFLNLPFGVVAVGLVVRGFSAYFLERAGEIPPVMIPATELGPVSVEGFTVSVWTRLAAFVLLGIAISLGGVRFTSYITAEEGESVEEGFPES
jgi:putative membrane protein